MKNDALTTNGELTNLTTQSKLVDLFFAIGSMRGRSEEVIKLFIPAYAENKLDALRVLFYSRDIRGGQGERQIFRDVIKYLAINDAEVIRKNINLFSEFGTYEDLYCLENTPLEADMVNLYRDQLIADSKNEDVNISLAGKWAASEGCKKWPTMPFKLMKQLGLRPKQYRKMLSSLREKLNVVEKKMCANNWEGINFNFTPSVAAKNYKDAFKNHQPERWGQYVAALVKGEAKVNAGAIFPHDIIKSLIVDQNKNHEFIEQQWKALPNFLSASTERIMTVCDTSGSMTFKPYGDGLRPLDICVSLGIYLSERMPGPFKNSIITFSTEPEIQLLKSTSLLGRVEELLQSKWQGTTNIEKTFKLILNWGIDNNISEELMPTTIVILSDMQFDKCTSGKNAHQTMKALYEKAGYKTPKIVFWNLNPTIGNNPVSYTENGTALVSGFSPTILRAIFAGENYTPLSVVRTVIDSQRYANVTI